MHKGCLVGSCSICCAVVVVGRLGPSEAVTRVHFIVGMFVEIVVTLVVGSKRVFLGKLAGIPPLASVQWLGDCHELYRAH